MLLDPYPMWGSIISVERNNKKKRTRRKTIPTF
jgi:hypothetical protein